MSEQPISDYRLIQQLEAAVAELERVVRMVAAVQVAPGHGYDLDAMDEAIIAARRVLAAGVTECRAEQIGSGEWKCDCRKPAPNCKPLLAFGVPPTDGGKD